MATAVTFRTNSGYNHSWHRARDGWCCGCAWHSCEGEAETVLAAVVRETANGDANKACAADVYGTAEGEAGAVSAAGVSRRTDASRQLRNAAD